MELLSKKLLSQYGFIENNEKSFSDRIVMSKDKFDIVIMDDGTFYYNVISYHKQINNVFELKELYKEMRGEELNK